jgi:hypothetical protein
VHFSTLKNAHEGGLHPEFLSQPRIPLILKEVPLARQSFCTNSRAHQPFASPSTAVLQHNLRSE